jgi:predicted membrane-bound spermidine synthase
MDDSVPSSARSAPNSLASLTAVFAFSGVAALAYQIVWQRLLFMVFGVDIESVTVIVSIFMAGLGIGGLLGGWIADRDRRHCVPYFCIAELGIGIFGLFSASLIGLLGHADGVMQLAFKSALMLLPPTILMGATLPLLSVAMIDRGALIGDAVGRLYYFNTLGAALACLGLGFVFFDHFGLHAALQVAAVMNGLSAALGLWLWWRS